MLWIKALHIIFVVSWFAGLFYLPRLFVNHAMVEDGKTRDQLKQMERKLYRFMTPLGILALTFGLWLWFGYGFSGGWLVREFAADRNRYSHVFYRWFNEIPVLILFAVVMLAVLKPF
jgi:putative membrane protein